MSKAKIKFVLLDIGDVLLHVDWDQFSNRLGFSTPEAVLKIRSGKNFDDLERGRFASSKFFEYIKNEFKLQHNLSEIAQAWDSVVVGELPGIKDLLHSYEGRGFNFYALSNASPTHIELRAKKYSLFKNFTKILTSYELGYRKPEIEIYHAALKEMGSLPHEVLFVDDLPENVAAAKSLGLHAEVCRRSADKLAEILSRYLS